jgi:hypothetical protein
MKKLFTLFVILGMTFSIFAQAPQKISYQAVIRDAGNNLVTSHVVRMQINILQGSAGGTSVYTETQTPTTNANGLVSIEIGGGTGFDVINWASGPYFLKTETDPTGGTNYTIVGTSQLLSVPYALYTKTAGTATDAVTITGDQTITGIKTFNNDLMINGLTVGKGKSSVAANTAVGGGTLHLNTTGNSNTAIGSTALYSNTAGNENSAIGSFALLANTTGSGNTAAGTMALDYNTTGSLNLAVGIRSLFYNSQNSRSTAIGVGAMYNADDNSSSTARETFNTAIGYEALRGSNTPGNNTGQGNTAVGDQALYVNTSGGYNAANGFQALYSNTTGYLNIANGYQALYSNIDGSWNTANGDHALSSNTSGSLNTADGSSALLSNIDGDGNTAIGTSALYMNTLGDNNTAIGMNADVGSNNLTNATSIGYYATVNASNKVRIGNSNVTVIEGQVNWSVGSDRRLKDNIQYSDKLGLEFVNELRTAKFTYKNDPSKRHHDGLIAQDVKQVLDKYGLTFSGLIESDNEEKTMNLAYAEFVIPLINAVQEQQKEINELKQLVKSLTQK